MELRNHPTLVNNCYEIASKMTNASRNFRSVQGLMNHYKAGDAFQGKIIDSQLDDAIRELREAAKRLEALKKNYKTYATEI
jgi:hypothetical protein